MIVAWPIYRTICTSAAVFTGLRRIDEDMDVFVSAHGFEFEAYGRSFFTRMDVAGTNDPTCADPSTRSTSANTAWATGFCQSFQIHTSSIPNAQLAEISEILRPGIERCVVMSHIVTLRASFNCCKMVNLANHIV